MSQESQSPEPKGPARLTIVVTASVVIFFAFLEVSNPPRAYAWVVYMCALAAVIAAGAAVREGMTAAPGAPPDAVGTRGGPEAESSFRSSRQPGFEPQPQTAPYLGRQQPMPRSPVGSRSERAALLPATTTVELSRAPRFGPGSQVHGVPWRVPEGPFPSGIAADQAQVGPLAVRCASVVGPGHRCGGSQGAEPGVPRQDAYRIGRTHDDGFLIIAVADGVSNARQSDTGANIAASYAVRYLREMLEADPDVAGLDAAILFERIAEQVAGAAAARTVPGRDLATVLIAAVLTVPEAYGEPARGWVAWVGDSSGWILDRNLQRWEQRFGDRKDQDEYTSNARTAALPHDSAAVQAVEFDLGDGTAFALTTDGIGDAWACRRMNDYFAQRWLRPLPAAELLNDVDFDARQRMGDRTAVVVWNGVTG